MKATSDRRRKREAKAKPIRDQLKAEVGRCEHCLKPKAPEYLDCDEIARGCDRQKALTAVFAILCVCRPCHRIIQPWSRAKRLGLLFLARSSDYDLEKFWKLTARNYPSQEDVDREIELILNVRSSICRNG